MQLSYLREHSHPKPPAGSYRCSSGRGGAGRCPPQRVPPAALQADGAGAGAGAPTPEADGGRPAGPHRPRALQLAALPQARRASLYEQPTLGHNISLFLGLISLTSYHAAGIRQWGASLHRAVPHACDADAWPCDHGTVPSSGSRRTGFQSAWLPSVLCLQARVCPGDETVNLGRCFYSWMMFQSCHL